MSGSPIAKAFLDDGEPVGKLLLVRHGQQVWPDPEKATTGDWVDPPLSETGHQQAAAVAEYLADEPVAAVYSSRLARANDTGAAIAKHHNLDVEIIDDLAEFEIFGNLPADARPREIFGEKLLAGARKRFVQTLSWDAFPESESSLAFRRRVGCAVEAALSAHEDETVVVACHGGVINAYLAETLGLQADMFFRAAHASVHRVRFRGDRRVIHSLNEHTFLQTVGLETY